MTATLLGRLLRTLCALVLALSLLACGGGNDSSSADNNPPGNDQNNDGPDDDDDGQGVDDDNDAPVATLSNTAALNATDTIAITFSEPMDPATLALGGSLAAHANVEWVDDATLRLHTPNWWPPGEQFLSVDANDRDGIAMQTLDASFEVAAAFSTSQAADVVIGQADFVSGDPRQDSDALSANANTLDHPESAVAWSEERQLLFIADTHDSRVLGFHGVPEVNNANADFVIGQADFTGSTGATTQSQMRKPQGITAQGGHLLVGDPESHRVLIYDPLPESGPGMASAVIGQLDFESIENGCGPLDINHSHGHFVTPSGRLLVADGVNNRVLVWNEIPETTGVEPDLVIGQSSFNLCALNDENQNGVNDENEQHASARTLQHPTDIWSDDERLVIVDNYNNRVLIWNAFPQENFAPADVVLGQADMQGVAPNDDDQDGVQDAAASARVLNYPWSVWVESGQLFVADENNHRVLVWNALPAESFTPADAVLGQPDFQGMAINAGGSAPAANTLNHPKGVRAIGDKLLVTDTANSRVLIFNAR